VPSSAPGRRGLLGRLGGSSGAGTAGKPVLGGGSTAGRGSSGAPIPGSRLTGRGSGGSSASPLKPRWSLGYTRPKTSTRGINGVKVPRLGFWGASNIKTPKISADGKTGPKTGDAIRGGNDTPAIKAGTAPIPVAAPRPGTTPTTSIAAGFLGGSPISIGGTTMSSRLGFEALSAQMVANAQKWNVEKGQMNPAAEELSRELNAAMANIARTMAILGGKCEAEQPLSPVLASILKGGAQGATRIGGLLANFSPVFKKVHAPDIQRQTHPRPNEQAWDPNARGRAR
jgi:hypothetical protein